jgi:hypothetical protein
MRAPGTILHTFKPGATEQDSIAVTGISPTLLEPGQQAALLAAVDSHQLVGVISSRPLVQAATSSVVSSCPSMT